MPPLVAMINNEAPKFRFTADGAKKILRLAHVVVLIERNAIVSHQIPLLAIFLAALLPISHPLFFAVLGVLAIAKVDAVNARLAGYPPLGNMPAITWSAMKIFFQTASARFFAGNNF